MSGTAGFNGRIYVTTTDTTPAGGDLLGDTSDLSFNMSANLLDDTAHGGDGARSNVYGLIESGYSITAFYNATSTVQTRIENALLNRTKLWFHYQPAGTAKTYKTQGAVESFDVGAPVDDLVSFSASIQGSKLPVIVTA